MLKFRRNINQIADTTGANVTELTCCKVDGSLAFVLRVSKVYGLADLNVSPLGNGYRVSLQNSCLLRTYSYIYFAVFTLVSVASFVHDWYEDDPNLMIRIRLGFSFSYFIFDILLSNLIAMITAFTMSNRTKRFLKYITDIERVNKNLSNSILNFNRRKSKIVMLSYFTVNAILSCITVVASVAMILHTKRNYLYTAYAICAHMKSAMQLIINMQFFFIICLLNDTLELIKTHLNDLNGKLNSINSPQPFTASSPHAVTRKLFHSYMCICNLINELTKNEGLMLLLLYIINVMGLMDNVYLFTYAYSFLDEFTFWALLKFILITFWFMYKVALVFLIVETCHRIKGKAILNTICRVMYTSSRVNLPVLYDFYLFQIPKLSLLGICNFTRPITATVLGAMATFLSIVKQFKIKDEAFLEHSIKS